MTNDQDLVGFWVFCGERDQSENVMPCPYQIQMRCYERLVFLSVNDLGDGSLVIFYRGDYLGVMVMIGTV